MATQSMIEFSLTRVPVWGSFDVQPNDGSPPSRDAGAGLRNGRNGAAAVACATAPSDKPDYHVERRGPLTLPELSRLTRVLVFERTASVVPPTLPSIG